MAKRIDWAVNVDKLRVCYNMPENLYDYLRMQDTRGDELTDSRILDEETFSLVFIEEDEVKMTAVLNVRDVEGFYRLGTFTFSNSAKYAGKAFFSFENSALYRDILDFLMRNLRTIYVICSMLLTSMQWNSIISPSWSWLLIVWIGSSTSVIRKPERR